MSCVQNAIFFCYQSKECYLLKSFVQRLISSNVICPGCYLVMLFPQRMLASNVIFPKSFDYLFFLVFVPFTNVCKFYKNLDTVCACVCVCVYICFSHHHPVPSVLRRLAAMVHQPALSFAFSVHPPCWIQSIFFLNVTSSTSCYFFVMLCTMYLLLCTMEYNCTYNSLLFIKGFFLYHIIIASCKCI